MVAGQTGGLEVVKSLPSSMSALGQKQTFSRVGAMSALPLKADIDCVHRDVRFVPKADIGEVYGTGLHYGPRVTLALGGPGLA